MSQNNINVLNTLFSCYPLLVNSKAMYDELLGTQYEIKPKKKTIEEELHGLSKTCFSAYQRNNNIGYFYPTSNKPNIKEVHRPAVKDYEVALSLLNKERLSYRVSKNHNKYLYMLIGGIGGQIHNDIVLFDVDNQKDADFLQKHLDKNNVKYIYSNTTHGKHFYFKNNGLTEDLTGFICLLGIFCDYKLGVNNAYACICVNGVERQYIESEALKRSKNFNIDTIPFYLKPTHSKNENLRDFLHQTECRNNRMQSYSSTIAKYCNYETYTKLITLVNQYIQCEEEETFLSIDKYNACREYSNVSNTHNNVFNHVEVGDLLIEQYKMKKLDRSVIYYLNNYYQSDLNDTDLLKHLCVVHNPNYKNNQRSEVASYIKSKMYLDRETPQAPAKYINCLNGILNLETLELLPHSDQYVLLNQIPHNFYVHAHSDKLEQALNLYSDGNLTVKQQILEAIGYCFYRNKAQFRKGFMLLGDKKAGKSSLLKLIIKLLGESNYSTLSLQDFNERFKAIRLTNKLANIGDDIAETSINDTSTIKKVISGNPFTVEEKGQPARDLHNYATVIFCANKLPAIKDDTGAFLDRLIVIQLKHKFEKTNFNVDTNYLNDTELLEALFFKSVVAFNDVLKRGEFTVDVEAKSLWQYINDPLQQFIAECFAENFSFLGYSREQAWSEYSSFVKDNQLNSINALTTISEFSKEICKRYNLTTQARRTTTRTYKVFVAKHKN